MPSLVLVDEKRSRPGSLSSRIVSFLFPASGAVSEELTHPTRYLSMPCSGFEGTWFSQPLSASQYYAGPDKYDANPCYCNAVFYSVVSGCAYCQGATVSTWFQWTPNCTAFQSETYPVGVVSGTSIPGWATLPVPASGLWDASAAYNYALSPSASITQGGSTTTAISTASGASLSQSSTAPASTQTSSSSSGKVIGAAVGGAVGGIGLLAGIGFAIWYFCLRKPGSPEVNYSPPEFDDEGKMHSPPIQVQPWNPDARPGNQLAYPNAAPTSGPMSPAPTSHVSYTTPGPMSPAPDSYASPQQSYALEPSQYSGPGSEVGGLTTYSEPNSAYGTAQVPVSYGIANPGPNQKYQASDPSQYSSGTSSYNPNAGYHNPAGGYHQPTSANPLSEGFDGGMHAPPPRYETPAMGSSLGADAAGANEKR
ncbi:hypothetical protein FRB90_001283 [Tulasnella sp. 427]|nr:hypothetical protein FRB90_001283 [Tulasnella sp. 427]